MVFVYCSVLSVGIGLPGWASEHPVLQGKVFLLGQLIRKLCVWSEFEWGDVVLTSELGHFAHRLFTPGVCTSVKVGYLVGLFVPFQAIEFHCGFALSRVLFTLH